jgi:group I intron endonuclease
MVTNTVNGKRYIGQSSCDDIKKRWDTHQRMRKKCLGTAIYRAYQKYGVDKFKYQIICICFDEDCNRFEEEYIKKYNTITPNGYNMKLLGGSYKVSDETRALLRQKAKSWWAIQSNRDTFVSPCKGKHLSDEHKQKLRNAQIARWNRTDRNNTNKVYKTEEKRQKALEGLAVGRNKNKKAIAQYTLSNELIKEYTSISEAVRETGICRSTISKVCLGSPAYKTAGGYLWKYVESRETP